MKPLAEMGRYATVVVDPPWEVVQWQRSTKNYRDLPYATMSFENLESMPVESVCKDSCWLFVWTTTVYLPDAIKLTEGWGCPYRMTMIWAKSGGPQPVGLPAYNAEFIVVGKRGNPCFMDTQQFGLVNRWPRREHSAKPEGFYDLLRRVTPAPRLDIFGRRLIGGFDSWGNEVPEGTAPPDSHQQVLIL